jgi:hypothetical protein
MRRIAVVAGALALVGPAALSTGASEQPPGLVATTPERYWDSRTMFTGDKNPPGGKIGVTTDEIAFDALGIDPDDPIPADAEAFFVNVTAVDAEGPGFVSVYPASAEGFEVPFEPDTSNLNVDTAGQTIANSRDRPARASSTSAIGDGSGAHRDRAHVDRHPHPRRRARLRAGRVRLREHPARPGRSTPARAGGAAADGAFDVDVIRFRTGGRRRSRS